jgi:hypothetical protein
MGIDFCGHKLLRDLKFCSKICRANIVKPAEHANPHKPETCLAGRQVRSMKQIQNPKLKENPKSEVQHCGKFYAVSA